MRRIPTALSAVVVSAFVASVLIASALAASGPATAAPAAGGTTSVTVFLKAPDAAALDQLATASGLTHSQRIAALGRLLPSDATRAAVAARLRSEGFTVTAETSWSVTATGSAVRSAALFGTRPTAGPNPSAARFAAATGALPELPAALTSSVAAVFPTTGGPAVFHHSAATKVLQGSDFRNADTPAGVAPQVPGHPNVTIATLQLSDFFGPTPGFANSQQAKDLHAYASAHAIPLGAGQYRALRVDGGPNPVTDDNNGNDVEVALDQESILSTAPTARQAAYFAPNSDAGFNDVFAQVLDDVLGTARAKIADPHIVALSSSWGLCESATDPASITALEPILKSLLAAGVTVFASSGDSGIYDCTTRASDVDYPASSPSVVGVGGTNLSSNDGAANTGTNWTETGWACDTFAQCTDPSALGGTGGGGGGSSTRFAAPAYQQIGIDDAPFAGGRHRLVPDIAADADPHTGFQVITNDPDATGPGMHTLTVGGTSLAAPISAAQLADTLANAGRTTGVGDIHGALYSAYLDTERLAATNPRKAFRDVVKGQNGAPADKAADPRVFAQPGYDTVSGLGGVLWKALTPYLVDNRHPSTTARLTEPSPDTANWRRIKAVWTITPNPGDTSRRQASVITLTAKGSSKPLFRISTFARSGSKLLAVTGGKTYLLTVTASDLAGRKSTSQSTVQLPVDDTVFRFSSGWHRTRGGRDFGGSHNGTSVRGATARISASGRQFFLVANTGPNAGRLGVFLGGKLVKRIDLFSAKAGHRTVHLITRTARGAHTFELRALGTKSARSHGTRVSVDALRVVF